MPSKGATRKAQKQARRDKKRADGICRDCPKPALPEYTRCQKHLDAQRKANATGPLGLAALRLEGPSIRYSPDWQAEVAGRVAQRESERERKAMEYLGRARAYVHYRVGYSWHGVETHSEMLCRPGLENPDVPLAELPQDVTCWHCKRNPLWQAAIAGNRAGMAVAGDARELERLTA